MSAPAEYSDAEVVRTVEQIIATSTNDLMIGTRVRVLFELRAQHWGDTGSGAGYDPGWPYDPRD